MINRIFKPCDASFHVLDIHLYIISNELINGPLAITVFGNHARQDDIL